MPKPTPTPPAEARPPAHTPRKRFGQHFLTDAPTIERIFAALALAPEDHVVEIGAGTGALTERLAADAASVVAIDIDRDLAAALAARLPGVRVVRADALRLCWRDLFTAPAAKARVRVVGNLPYNIATPLLAALLPHAHAVFDFHVMVQAEVAARLVASPGTKAYGRLSVLAGHHCVAARLFDVPPWCFSPPPKVHSAFVRLRAAADTAPCDADAFHTVLRACFGQRRKTLGKALSTLGCDAAALGLDPHGRAERLTVRDFVAIAERYAARNNQP